MRWREFADYISKLVALRIGRSYRVSVTQSLKGAGHFLIVSKTLVWGIQHQGVSAAGTGAKGSQVHRALAGSQGWGQPLAESQQEVGPSTPHCTELHLTTITGATKSSRWDLSPPRTFTSAPEPPSWEPVSHAQTCGSHSCELTHGCRLSHHKVLVICFVTTENEHNSISWMHFHLRILYHLSNYRVSQGTHAL